ncbi:hypothetical protein ACFL5O_06330 [Myxococcota bacterium]
MTQPRLTSPMYAGRSRDNSWFGSPCGWLGWWSAWWCALFLILFSAPARADEVESLQPGNKPIQVPKELMSWVPWVVEALTDELCVKIGEQPVCRWPARVELDVEDGGAVFRLEATLDREGPLPLPGSAEAWPLQLKANGDEAVVLERSGSPTVWLSRGAHRLVGSFRWKKAPETLPVPPTVALIGLKVHGLPVTHPRREAGGALWLQASTADAGETPERLEVEVFRRLDDGVPVQVTTQLALRVAGATRELRLEAPLVAGSRAIAVVSPLPLRFEPNGDLVLQARPGEHKVEVRSVLPQPPRKLTVPRRALPWPPQEIWVWNPDTDVRQAILEGAPSVDPAQTNLPSAWRDLQAFLMSPERTLLFGTQRRGEAEPPPNRLSLSRQLWLDLDGGGYTVQDRLTGEMSRGWRLELPAAPLGRAVVDGTDWLVTRNAAGVTGIELRQGKVKLDAEWRLLSGTGDLPAVGWASDVQTLSATLHLPPGWELFAASGVDSASRTWLSQWTLWAFFFVLVVALAVARLVGPPAGALALTALALSYHRDGAPVATWAAVLMLVALLHLVPESRFRTVLRAAWFGAALVLAVVVVMFVVQEVRLALFPSTEKGHEEPVRTATSSVQELERAHSSTEPVQPSPTRQQDEGTSADQQPSQLSQSLSPAKGRKAAGSLAGTPVPYSAKREQAAMPTQEPEAVLQTGPGLPNWNWRKILLRWSGPVQRDQRIGLWLLTPPITAALGLLRALLVAWLAYRLIKATPHSSTPPPKIQRSGKHEPLVTLVAVLSELVGTTAALHLARSRTHRSQGRGPLVAGVFALLLGMAWSTPAFAAEPSPETLSELRSRLIRRPDCDPCVVASRLEAQLEQDVLRLDAEVHAGAVTAYQLPGPARSWVPASVSVDGHPSLAMVSHDDGFLHVRLTPGRHQVRMVGPVASHDLTLALGTQPRHVTVLAPGWRVDGLQEGRAQGSLRFSRTAENQSGVESAGAPERVTLPPWLQVTRVFRLATSWQAAIDARRVSPEGEPVSIRYPLLTGEEVTTPGALVEGGMLVIALRRDQSEASYQTLLKPRAQLELVASKNQPWSEDWRVRCSPIWHCQFQGLAPSQLLEEGQYAPRFLPWPNERLLVKLSKPVAATGASRTVDAVNLRLTAGQRLMDAHLELAMRVSKGGVQVIALPPGAQVQALSLNGKAEPIRVNADRLELALRPGRQNIAVSWHQAVRLETLFRAAPVGVGGEAVNVKVEVVLPTDRWLLFTAGPSWGPKVLLWVYVLLVLAAAAVLGSLPRNPLPRWQWWLLGLGLTQVPVVIALIIASWFFAVVARGAWRPQRSWSKALVQVLLPIWTLVFLGCLVRAVYSGLVTNPDMMVSGAMAGNQLHLQWYWDRLTDRLPSPWVLSAPLWVWRVLNLLWALWLAWTLLGWLRWAWGEYARGGLWGLPALPAPAANGAMPMPPAMPADDPHGGETSLGPQTDTPREGNRD